MIITSEMRSYPNEHRDRITQHFGGACASLDLIPSDIRYGLICFTNRCGSHFLAECLASSAYLNNAGESFHADLVISDSLALGHQDLGAFVGNHVREYQQNGIFLTKTSATQLIMLAEAGILDRIAQNTCFILLERCDKLAQAISYAVAWGSNSWTSEQAPSTDPSLVDFPPDIISGFIDGVTFEMLLLERFFARNGISPHRVFYEDLEADPAGGTARVGGWLGLSNLRFDQSKIHLKRQRGTVNDEWRRQFREWQKIADL
jgi:LPS sulfotransferase NodH